MSDAGTRLSMLARCLVLGFPVEQVDAASLLNALPLGVLTVVPELGVLDSPGDASWSLRVAPPGGKEWVRAEGLAVSSLGIEPA
jgi:hypothetical protein